MNNFIKFFVCKFPESSSDLVEGSYGNTNSRLIYGVFTTPQNAIAGSAVCAFTLQVRMKSIFMATKLIKIVIYPYITPEKKFTKALKAQKTVKKLINLEYHFL